MQSFTGRYAKEPPRGKRLPRRPAAAGNADPGRRGNRGVALTACTLAGVPAGIALSAGVLFALLCPWAVWPGVTLPAGAGEV